MSFERLFDWIDRTPAWVQPAAIGASVLALMVAVRALFLIPVMFKRPQLLFGAIEAILAASAAGACGGFAYSLLGRHLLQVRWVGRYLTGIICVGAYLLPLVLVLPLVFPDMPPSDRGAFNLHDPVARYIWIGCTLFFGLVVGHTWFEATPRPRHARDDSSVRHRSNER